MAGFSIVTNINSLIAQENLGKTNLAQQRTIERLTSGLRINSSADDAAGLAVANRFRSDIAVLQQGVRNAADGLSTLQTIDGGLNNVALLLDRGRTLATQSASGTFTGDRNALNSEFQSVIEEINRQAQAIGLDPGGQFNAALQVFIGGGRANNGISETANGAVSIDLSNSAVSAGRLGLEGVRALGGVEGTTDIGNSSTTSVGDIVANATNTASVSNAGFTEFEISGPGFSDEGAAQLAVNLSGVVDASTLAAAINSAITGFTSTSAAGEAFKNAEIRAVINTDTTGKQQLAFTSSTAAFQVKAGDRLANALLGNFDSGGPAGASLDVTRTGAVSAATAAAADVISVELNGGG
jgi:flagellin